MFFNKAVNVLFCFVLCWQLALQLLFLGSAVYAAFNKISENSICTLIYKATNPSAFILLLLWYIITFYIRSDCYKLQFLPHHPHTHFISPNMSSVIYSSFASLRYYILSNFKSLISFTIPYSSYYEWVWVGIIHEYLMSIFFPCKWFQR